MTNSNQRVTVLFTANLRANFELMPFLATTIRQARSQSSASEPHPTLLLDLGGAWSSTWICQATENRAPYLILDAMGYAVARADGLDVGGILGLRDSVQVFLMDDSIVYKWHSLGVTINVGPKGEAPAISWPLVHDAFEPDAFYKEEAGRIVLYPPQDYIGKLVVEWPSMRVQHAEKIHGTATRPDPSIIEMIKFVEAEAHAYERRQQKGD